MSVYEGIKGKAVSPASGEVLDVDLRVPGRGEIFCCFKCKPWRTSVLTLSYQLGTLYKWSRNPLFLFYYFTAHPAVFIWHQSSRASLAERVSLLSSVSILITWIWTRSQQSNSSAFMGGTMWHRPFTFHFTDQIQSLMHCSVFYLGTYIHILGI